MSGTLPQPLTAGRELDALIAAKVMGLATMTELAPAIFVEGEWSIYGAADVPTWEPANWLCHAGMQHVYARAGCDCMTTGPVIQDVEATVRMMTEGKNDPADEARWRDHAKWSNASRVAEYNADIARWGHDHYCLSVVPEYSTEIAAAWLVVEKVGLSVVQSDDGWYAFKPEDIEHDSVRGTDVPRIALVGRDGQRWEPQPTMPLAVCLAALDAHRAASLPHTPHGGLPTEKP